MAGQLKVDSQGMRQKVTHRGLLGILQELTSNAFDENIPFCDVTVEQVTGRTYRVRVEDDSPEGFRNLEEIDHYIGGDGSANGSRTLRTALSAAMAAVEPSSVTSAYRDEIAAIARQFFPGRTGVNVDGFAERFLP